MCLFSPQDFEKFVQMVETTIDLEQIENHEFLVRPSFHAALQQVDKRTLCLAECVRVCVCVYVCVDSYTISFRSYEHMFANASA